MHLIVLTLFAARDLAHRLHLGTRSFSQHVALGDLYEEATEVIDELAEVWQGRNGLLDLTATPTSGFYQFLETNPDPASFARAWSDYMVAVRPGLPDGPILNLWDELGQLVDRALYKLTYLA